MALEVEAAPTAERGDAPFIGRPDDVIVVGLVNNMPDSALEGTESQFRTLLSAAADDRNVKLRFSSLPEVPRGTDAHARISERYWTLDRLLADRPDALIVTGTEPRAPVLSDEPYWGRFVELIEYALENTISSAWSCLAAHAAVLYLDGIERRRLAAKRFGVFEQRVLENHELMRGIGPTLHTPHSRWNDLSLECLERAGYAILSQSPEAGADAFATERGGLMLFFQGHPEYEERTLLKEYQRDVGRYVSGEYKQYPGVPASYFGPEALAALQDFERRLMAGELKQPLAEFPFKAVAASLNNSWRTQAVQIYRNWFEYIAAKKLDARVQSRHAV